MAEEVTMSNVVVDEEPDNDKILEQVEKTKDIPRITDDGWNEYVFTKFRDDELFNGNPTVDGLRRVTELVLGPITKSITNIVDTACPENEFRVTAQHYISVIWDNYPHEDRFVEREVQDAADIHFKNADPKYLNYPTALAATRAEGRALRKMLRLKCVAAEEVADSLPQDDDSPKVIQPFQANSINVMCSRLDIDVVKFLKATEHGPFDNVDEVPYVAAQKLIQSLNVLQRNKDKIPQKIKGYKSNWRQK